MTCCSLPLNHERWMIAGPRLLKSCPGCSLYAGRHVYHALQRFGLNRTGTPHPQSYCAPCRFNAWGAGGVENLAEPSPHYSETVLCTDAPAPSAEDVADLRSAWVELAEERTITRQREREARERRALDRAEPTRVKDYTMDEYRANAERMADDTARREQRRREEERLLAEYDAKRKVG